METRKIKTTLWGRLWLLSCVIGAVNILAPTIDLWHRAFAIGILFIGINEITGTLEHR